MRRRERNEFRAGVAALLAIGAIVAGTIIVPMVTRPPRLTYEVRVPADVDLTDLAKGSPVHIGGLTRGRVLGLEDEFEGGRRSSVVIHFEVDPDPPLFPEARARIERNPVSKQATLSFIGAGTPGAARLPIANGGRITIDKGVDLDESVLPARLQHAMKAIGERFDAAEIAWPKMTDDAGARLERLRRESEALADAIDASWPDLRERASALLDRFTALDTEMHGVADEVRRAQAELDAWQALVDEGGAWPRLRVRFDEVARAWRAFRDNATDVRGLLERLGTTSDRAGEIGTHLVQRARAIVAELAFADDVADLFIAASEFGKLFDEAISAPWTVLFPNESARERRRAALDDLSRGMLLGIAEAKAARGALAELVARGALGTEALERLGASVEQLDSIEQALWQLRTGPDRRR